MAQLSRYQVPNALSASRVPIGVAVWLLASRNQWQWAFGLLVLGVATDVFDGALARRWKPESISNGDIWDKYGDGVLVVGALAGLITTANLPDAVLGVGVGLLLVTWIINNIAVNQPIYKRFGIWFTPLFYLAVTWVLVLIYGFIAIPDDRHREFLVADLAVTLVLIITKRGRIGYWFDRIMQRPHPPAPS